MAGPTLAVVAASLKPLRIPSRNVTAFTLQIEKVEGVHNSSKKHPPLIKHDGI